MTTPDEGLRKAAKRVFWEASRLKKADEERGQRLKREVVVECLECLAEKMREIRDWIGIAEDKLRAEGYLAKPSLSLL